MSFKNIISFVHRGSGDVSETNCQKVLIVTSCDASSLIVAQRSVAAEVNEIAREVSEGGERTMAATPGSGGGGSGGGGGPDLLSLVASLDASLLPCLPARELQAVDRSTHPSHQVDVERHAADFMEAAKTLQLYFIRAQHQHQPSREEALKKEIAALEAELKVKDALMEKQSKLLRHWQSLLEAQKNTLIEELERV